MTLALIVVSLWVSAILALGALGVDRLLRAVRLETRFVWIGAMAASVTLVAVSPLRSFVGTRAPEPTVASPASGALTFASGITADAVGAAQRLPAWAGTALLWSWAAASLITLAILALGYRHHRRRAADAPETVIAGAPVRVSEDFGPAVIGVARPWIVVPRWLLSRSAEEQALVIAHEREHVARRDPLLLLVAMGALVLIPWNPVLWWCFAQLRLATELDCDARVLRGGVPASAYGSLLLDLTAALPRPRLGVPAFASRPSQLERRLLAMTTRPLSPGRRRASIAASTLVALAALVSACSAEVKAPLAEAEQKPTVVEANEPYFDFQVEKPATPIPGSGSPRYPAILRSAAVEGQVVAQFVVDTAGRIEIDTYKAVKKSHDLFDASVRAALAEMRFTPAEVGGRKVRMLMQQPFVFQLSR